MCSLPTIGIHNNFTACKTGITMRTADNKFSGGINKEKEIIIK